ncbi:hypothetical protein [Planomonospora venezuelensis]|uniref:Uncharacterized protein n=1 Tax=Planomonospora venezuelensis TaxID=1999 RepID=A0A841CWR5_PLAVE|nr:hypothetical protein [Planomonospora venezuelensis]MBB5961263.1 hypothetical protein [Planomonospora venezuelensis]GIM99937.1 hypothetical protein Pve01_15960 [Planomonospora venezuelensis]
MTAYRVGDVVEVLSVREILATLDEDGELDGLPFMPEMLEFCGRRLTVGKVAHKLCDTIERSGLRRMPDAVHLTGSRCDGSAHGGCQTACLLYWKTAWLKRVEKGPGGDARDTFPPAGPGPVDVEVLSRRTSREPFSDGSPRYACQATEILRAAPERLPVKDLRQYAWDVRSGNNTVAETVRGVLIALFDKFQYLSRRVLPRWLRLRGGRPWGFLKGRAVGPTPVAALDLKPGEIVRIRSKREIELTLNERLQNRGMGFEDGLTAFCGRTARVTGRVERCIDETTGRMLQMKTPSVVLENVVCPGTNSLNCPRGHLPFWREIWLERVEQTKE